MRSYSAPAKDPIKFVALRRGILRRATKEARLKQIREGEREDKEEEEDRTDLTRRSGGAGHASATAVGGRRRRRPREREREKKNGFFFLISRILLFLWIFKTFFKELIIFPFKNSHIKNKLSRFLIYSIYFLILKLSKIWGNIFKIHSVID